LSGLSGNDVLSGGAGDDTSMVTTVMISSKVERGRIR
jgi:hypothetical protein